MNKFATNAKFSFSWPFLTSYKVRLVSLSEVPFELLFTLGVTNCLQPILSAWSSITPALSTKSDFCIAVLFTPASYQPSEFWYFLKCLETLGAIWWSRSV